MWNFSHDLCEVILQVLHFCSLGWARGGVLYFYTHVWVAANTQNQQSEPAPVETPEQRLRTAVSAHQKPHSRPANNVHLTVRVNHGPTTSRGRLATGEKSIRKPRPRIVASHVVNRARDVQGCCGCAPDVSVNMYNGTRRDRGVLEKLAHQTLSKKPAITTPHTFGNVPQKWSSKKKPKRTPKRPSWKLQQNC